MSAFDTLREFIKTENNEYRKTSEWRIVVNPKLLKEWMQENYLSAIMTNKERKEKYAWLEDVLPIPEQDAYIRETHTISKLFGYNLRLDDSTETPYFERVLP